MLPGCISSYMASEENKTAKHTLAVRQRKKAITSAVVSAGPFDQKELFVITDVRGNHSFVSVHANKTLPSARIRQSCHTLAHLTNKSVSLAYNAKNYFCLKQVYHVRNSI